MAKKQLSYEEAMLELEQVMAKLENGESTLDESVNLFKQGLEMIKRCNACLNKAENQIKVLVDDEFVDFVEG